MFWACLLTFSESSSASAFPSMTPFSADFASEFSDFVFSVTFSMLSVFGETDLVESLLSSSDVSSVFLVSPVTK